MKNKAAIEKLREDENYYGKFGKQYLVIVIFNFTYKPFSAWDTTKANPAFLVGGYFTQQYLSQISLKKYKDN
jgi:hypothetical protein